MARKRATDLSKTDMTMLVLIVLLVIFGLAVLFSSSEYNGRVRFGDSACYFKKQLFATALGMGVMYMVSSIDYHFFLRLGPVAYLISMFLSGAVLFVGQEINGSKRWLNLGPLSFQPSEFAKVAVILFLAWQIERTKKATRGFGFMCRTILTLLPIIGLVGSNNLSTAIIILGIGGILIFVSNPGYLEFIGLGSAGAGFIAVFLAAESYRLERLAIWRNPEKYEKGFQTIQGLYAIGSGGIFGRGFGNSLQKLGFVPEAQNDMIFAVICEELGILGAFIMLGMFLYLIFQLFKIASRAETIFGRAVVTGIAIHISLQVIVNIFVVLMIFPNTGVSLPFISYGGSAVIFTMAEMGIALSVDREHFRAKVERKAKQIIEEKELPGY